jgi:hypothetical protein
MDIQGSIRSPVRSNKPEEGISTNNSSSHWIRGRYWHCIDTTHYHSMRPFTSMDLVPFRFHDLYGPDYKVASHRSLGHHYRSPPILHVHLSGVEPPIGLL